MTVYFVQGSLTLASLAKLFFLKDEIGLSEVQYATLTALAMLPVTIKPLYGMVSDFLPLFGRRRKYYVLIGSAINAAAWVWLGTGVGSYWEAFAALTLTILGLGIVDVIADGMVIERSNKENVGRLQTLCWLSLSIGALSGTLLGGWLMDVLEIRTIFLLTALLPALTFVQGIGLHDPKVERAPHQGETWRSLCILGGVAIVNIVLGVGLFCLFRWAFPAMAVPEALANGVMIAFALGNFATVFIIDRYVHPFPKWIFFGAVLFLFLWRAMPNIGAAFQYYLINDLGWDQGFLKWFLTFENIGNIAGAVAFWFLVDKWKLRTAFFWTILVGSLVGLVNLVYVYKPAPLMEPGLFGAPWILPFALVVEFVVGFLYYVGFLPLFKLAARIIPQSVEATLFALVASFMNVGLMVAVHGGGLLTQAFGVGVEGDYGNLDKLIMTATLLPLVLLLLLWLVPEEGETAVS